MIKFLLTNPVGWVTLAVGAISTVVLGVKQYRENITKAAEESKEAISEITDSYKKLNSTVSDIKRRYAELAQGINQYTGKNKSLSNDEYAEFLDLSNQLAELFPSLTKRYDENGNAILSLSGDVDTIVDSLTNLVEVEKQLANEKIIDELPNVLKGYNQNRSDLDGELKSLEEWRHDLEVAYKSLQDINKVYKTGFLNNDSGYLEAIHVLSELDIKHETIDYEEGFGFGTIALENYDDSLDKISRSLKTVTLDISNLNSRIKSENAEFNKYLSSWLFDDWAYISLNDSELQNVIQEMLFNTDWLSEAKSQGVNTKKWDEVSEWIEKNYISAIANIDDDEVRSALIDLYSIPTDEQSISEYVEQFEKALRAIQTYCKENGIEIPINISDNNTIDTYKRLQNSIRQLTDDHGITDREKYAYLMNEVDFQSFTQAQAELWLEATRGAQNAEEAIQMYKDKLDELEEDVENANLSLSITQTISQLNTKLKPALDSLKSAYKDIFTDDGEFALNSIDILSACDSIKSKLDDMAESGLSIDYSSYEDFVRVLSDSESESDDVKLAFDSLATSITHAALSGAEDFETMKAALKDLGVVNNEIVAFDALVHNAEMLDEALAKANVSMDDFIVNTEDGSVVATTAGEAFLREKVGAENCAVALNILAFHKQLYSKQGINTAEEVANLRTLAENAGYTGEVIQYLTELERIYQEVASGTLDPGVVSKKMFRAAELQTLIRKAATEIDYKPIEKSADKAGSSAGEAFADALDKELAALDKKMEAGYIDFNDYIQARLALIEDYYKQGKIKADEYYSYLEKHYKQELSYRDKVIKAVTRRIDKEIKNLEKQKDDIKSYYKVQIESLEKQKSLLEEANKERERQLDLQKSLYELERARNQRTKLIYSEDKGMHYVADDQSIRDAKQGVDSVKYDIQIDEIEKSISKLEEARDNQIDAIDEMILKLEEYKDAWNDITSAYEEAQEDLIAAQILGSNWETDILNGRLDVLDNFKNQYIAIQQAMADAAWKSANEQIKAAKEAEKGSFGSVSNASKIERGTSISKVTGGGYDNENLGLSNRLSKHIYNKEFRAYKSGTSGLSHDEKNALVSEYGQTEMTVFPNGNAVITDKPTFMDLPKDTVIYNEEETKKIMDNKIDVSGNAHADGTDGNWWIGPDGHRYRDLQPGDKGYDMMKAFEPLVDKILKGEMDIISNAVFEGQKQMEQWTKEITNNTAISNITNNRSVQPIVNHISVTCPGVTEQQVAERIGSVLGKELDKQFSGFHNYTDQMSSVR